MGRMHVLGREKDMDRADRALFAILEALAAEPLLARGYVLKGGLALRLLYGGPRPSDDLDLSSAKPFTDVVTDEKNEMLLAFCDLLDESLRSVESGYDLEEMHVAEKTLSTEIPALLGSVGYRDTADSDHARKSVYEVKMQVTLSELICETARFSVNGIAIHAAVLEDILADKLKAMLQQVTRNKLRPMDVYDVWFYSVRSSESVDLDRLRQYLEIKAARWPEVYPPTRQRFHSRDLHEYSSAGFPDLIERLERGAPRVSFEDAFAGVLSLVDRLELPELQAGG